jgi:ligand-binding sensor protein
MNLTKVLPIDAWVRFESDLFKRFGMNCTVYDLNGTSITGKPNWSNRLCPKIKADREALAAICSPSNQYFMAEAKKTGKPVLGECDAGFVKLAVPIIINDEFLGTAGGCGLLPAGGGVEPFLIEKTLGFSEAEIMELCRNTGVMTTRKAGEMVAYIERLIGEFASAPAPTAVSCS